jgi:hypothetical protein
MGSHVSANASRKAGAIAGDVFCNSPEECHSQISPWNPDSRQSKTGETTMKRMVFVLAVCFIAGAGNAAAQQPSSEQKQDVQGSPATCPMHDAHSQMNERGEKGMGFSQTATTHHFFLNSSGGVIQVEANDAVDASDRSNIRMHLEHIAKSFQNGDFDIPMFVHDTAPPGVPEMKKLRENIHYSFEETANGGRVVISSSDKDALAAIHRFLRFQIEEHKTGDPMDVH